ncbi:hypothetical protein KCF3NO3_19880 [Chryseobacterium sp. KCF3-3]
MLTVLRRKDFISDKIEYPPIMRLNEADHSEVALLKIFDFLASLKAAQFLYSLRPSAFLQKKTITFLKLSFDMYDVGNAKTQVFLMITVLRR